MHSSKQTSRHLSPPIVIAGSFLLLIIIGTLLLKLPVATTQPITWTDALFTATSATTVTGLSVFDIGTTLTLFGQIVMLFLIQFGGIGLMTFAVAVLIMFGRKVGMQHRIYIQESFNEQSIGGMVKLVKRILLFVVIAEGVAIVLLSVYWAADFGWVKGIYYSIFHVISAFNNAGFALFPDNLIQFAGDPVVLFTLSSLFIVGGIGFVVVTDIFTKKSFRKWSLHTKLMISGTLLINAVATLVLFILEYHNPHTIGDFSWAKKLLVSYFQAVSPRTAGFNAVSMGEMEDSSLLFTMFLMFIGGGSASTASGIKLTTFIVVIFATMHYVRGIPEPHLFGRSIKIDVLIRSLAITTLSIFVVMGSLFLLTITENLSLLALAVEVFSAFGTVGLSVGITAELSNVGKVLLCIVMFIGRIGPLTLFFLLLKKRRESYHLPYDQVHTG
ncbi:TrkH family potassium uptake protein [Sporosarcina sp. YIM B06819]|uniref:TrkH family potassium uptake protein n=1 Tax=Sporosarcina sp. YIM B06819 TaxID=3081769 RepID=UPI00298C4256|nr:TrkH family potassium uptake protein [Sporosarcina sp. YIM B06819]